MNGRWRRRLRAARPPPHRPLRPRIRGAPPREVRRVKTWRLRTSQWVPRPPEQVFPFFADARNLEQLTPPWLSFTILTPMPIPMAVGTLIDYRIALHGVPMRWRTRIARWEPGRAFADEQLRGPYVLWHHTHTFTPCDGGTVLGDDVVMRPKGGPFAGLVMRLFVRRDVQRIFEHRARVLAETFGARDDRAELRWVEPAADPAAAEVTAVGAP